MADLILVADDDPDIARFVEVNLKLDGFEVAVANDGEQALQMALELHPSLILLDVMMPKMNGVEVCRHIRADRRTAQTNVIMLTAKSLGADKIAGLTAGADDYIIKPFDPLELVARVHSTLRRTREMRAQSPLTGLPGNVTIEAEVKHRLNGDQQFAICYADLDNFKAFNDHYGFMRGDKIIVFTADTIVRVASEVDENSFVGHIGGDDFLILTVASAVEKLCSKIIEQFDSGVASFYDTVDAERGYIEVENRQKVANRFAMLSISIGVAIANPATVDDHRRIAETATEMKTFAKTQEGSVYAIDRRRQ
ncbi:MAG: response regulator [Actinomycetota bacterium]|nr:response regulator [Actinomycetota bacterium]